MIVAGVAGGVVGIILGNRLRLSVIQRIFAAFLAIIAIYMMGQQFRAPEPSAA